MATRRVLKFCFLSFCLAQFISIFGDRLHQFAVVGMIGRIAPASPMELFQFALFSHLPVLLLAPILGALVDRSNKIWLLLAVDLVRGLIVLIIPALYSMMDSLYAFYIPVFFLSAANLLFVPAKSSILPELFEPLRLLRLNAILLAVGIIATLTSFLLGGWFFDSFSWQLSFYVDGGSYLLSMVFLIPLFWGARAVARKATSAPSARVASIGSTSRYARVEQSMTGSARGQLLGGIRSIRRSFTGSISLIRNNCSLAYALLVQTALFATLGALYVVGIAHMQTVVATEKLTPLSIVAVVGTGGLLLGAAATSIVKRWVSSKRLIAHATLVLAVAWVGLGTSNSLTTLAFWAGLLGLAVSPIMVITETLLQAHAPDTHRGRLFSTREVLSRTAFLLLSMLGALAARLSGEPVTLITVGVLLAVTGVLLESKAT